MNVPKPSTTIVRNGNARANIASDGRLTVMSNAAAPAPPSPNCCKTWMIGTSPAVGISPPIANAKKSTIAIHIESRGAGARAAVGVVIAFHFLWDFRSRQIKRFPKKFRGRRQILVGVPCSSKNSEQIGSWWFHSAPLLERGAFGNLIAVDLKIV
jgi:hypothetical protein